MLDAVEDITDSCLEDSGIFGGRHSAATPRASAKAKVSIKPPSRPQSASSMADDLDDMEVFELPPELGWLSRATSHPGAMAVEPESEQEFAVPPPQEHDQFGFGSRCSSRSSIAELHEDEPEEAPVKVLIAPSERSVKRSVRPQHGTMRAKGGRSRPWSWRKAEYSVRS